MRTAVAVSLTIVGVICAAGAVGAFVWWRTAPVPRPGEREVEAIGCSEANVSPPAHGTTVVSCTPSRDPPACSAVLAAYRRAVPERSGETLIVIEHGKARHTCAFDDAGTLTSER